VSDITNFSTNQVATDAFQVLEGRGFKEPDLREQFNDVKELGMESDEKVKLIEKFRVRVEDARRCEEGDELAKLPGTGVSGERGECDEELSGLI
jgi:hypothetical protein